MVRLEFIGSAGTGKTVVALHRAVRLARDPDAKVLLTTFNHRLADRLHEKLPLLATEDVRSRIVAASLGVLIRKLHSEQFGDKHVATRSEIVEFMSDAARSAGLSAEPDFLFDEWTLIVDAWDVRDQETYRDLPRLGRKIRMPVAHRDTLWAVFRKVREEIEGRDWTTPSSMAHRLRREGIFPFTHAVVDEAQDISVAQLLLFGAVLGSRVNGLFFAGDIGQRIFRPPFPWTATGVELRGRSRSLKVNYRTSHQIRRQSEGLLPERLVEADGGEENRLGVTSVFEGPAPIISTFRDRKRELEALTDWLRGRGNGDPGLEDVAVLVRTSELVDTLEPEIGNLAVVMTMHDAMGAEFRSVAVVALDDDIVPLEKRLLGVHDGSQLDEVMNTERHLLYVAATRARDHLWLSGVEPISEFLADLID